MGVEAEIRGPAFDREALMKLSPEKENCRGSLMERPPLKVLPSLAPYSPRNCFSTLLAWI